MTDRKIVVVNQAVNYLTVGLCNEFAARFTQVALITGNVHSQGEELSGRVELRGICKWREQHGFYKAVLYARTLLQIYLLLWTRYRRHEVFFVSVPPMAYLLNVFLPHRCSMLIWDIYPDIFKITGMQETHPVYRLWSWLNRVSFRRAYRLFTIGEKMAELLARYVPRESIIVQPVWSIFQKNDRVAREQNPFVEQHHLQGKFVVQYSGNIGLTHRVEVMVELAERMHEYPDILFQVIGRGPRVPVLKKLMEDKRLENCQFLPFQTDDMFPFSLSAAALGVVILDELTSQGSVPSKAYNLMAYGIPSLYIAAPGSELHSYAERFGHALCLSKTQLDQAVAFIARLSQDKELHQVMSARSLAAATCFRRDNARKFVDHYLGSKLAARRRETIHSQ
jgi:hypothetical protein